MRLDHVGLAVADLPAMAQWYGAALDLEVELEFALDYVDFRGVKLRSPDGKVALVTGVGGGMGAVVGATSSTAGLSVVEEGRSPVSKPPVGGQR